METAWRVSIAPFMQAGPRVRLFVCLLCCVYMLCVLYVCVSVVCKCMCMHGWVRTWLRGGTEGNGETPGAGGEEERELAMAAEVATAVLEG